ncbi:hypothetical protein C7N43_21215 [Sphingobacteriales bacterium UPWRP_1]|nr:hypothetical protein BVG80_16090 [Sphingobacteriales bacterium TSM_CSM]PSJ74994.1 hypothetical protein C7N43_21215 [Sphingobacteriales bacterium UPWRP_1]
MAYNYLIFSRLKQKTGKNQTHFLNSFFLKKNAFFLKMWQEKAIYCYNSIISTCHNGTFCGFICLLLCR